MDIKKIDSNTKESIMLHEGIKWVDLDNEFLRGTAFQNGFVRLGKDHFVSKQIEVLKKHPSGMNITFRTDARSIAVKAKLVGPSYMAHMTAVGQVGFDLYEKKGEQFCFLATTKINQAAYEVTLAQQKSGSVREYRLYFPLYQQLEEAYLGLPEEASLEWVKPNQDKIVVYGTSITQGGCATRPGMSYTNILDRITDYEWINLGFSGSAHLEKEMISILNAIPKKALILEVDANNTLESLKESLPWFLAHLTGKPVYLITHFPMFPFTMELEEKKAFQQTMKNCIVLDGEKLLQDLGYEGTVDGVHLTDLGFYHLALKLKEIILDKGGQQ